MQKIFLASASPRRSALLRDMGVAFEAAPGSFVEPPHAAGQTPRSYVKANARDKALQVASGITEGIVIGADTVVVLRGRVLGKPSSMDEARRYLRMLNGQTHEVLTGLCITDAAQGSVLVEAEKTRVTFRHLSAHEMDRYLELINPLDKAGAYAIQAHGAIIVERIAGCYYNVMGFPLARLETMLMQWGCSLFDCMGQRDRQ
jgi:septum formation protein